MKALYQTYQHFHAPEIYGEHWFNSEPIFIRELQGRPTLLFFCDRTSHQSQQLLPFVNGMHALYYEYGLTCIGIHSPEFSFGKNPKKIEEWIKKEMIFFPVVTDNERPIANAYRISSVPAFCLIDNKGDVYDTILKSFSPERIERSVQYLLRQSGYRGELPILLNPARDTRYLMAGEIVREIFMGYFHGALGNPEGYNPELPSQYEDPKIYFTGKFYANGNWRAERNAFLLEEGDKAGYVVCQSEGDEMTLLAGSETKTTIKIESDDEPLSILNMGDDVQKDKQGNTFIVVDEPRLFSVIKGNNAESHTVKFIPQNFGVRFYMLTFESASAAENESLCSESFRNN